MPVTMATEIRSAFKVLQSDFFATEQQVDSRSLLLARSTHPDKCTDKAAAHLSFITLEDSYNKIKEWYRNDYIHVERIGSRETAKAKSKKRDMWPGPKPTAQEATLEKKEKRRMKREKKEREKLGKRIGLVVAEKKHA